MRSRPPHHPRKEGSWKGAGLGLALLAIITPGKPFSQPFVLSAEKRIYLQGEPVYLRMESRSPAAPPSLEEGSVLLVIKDGKGRESIYRPPLRLRNAPAAFPSTPASFRYARLIAAEGGLVFRRPGRYILQLRAPGGSGGAAGTGLSDTCALSIRKPSSGPDRKAFALISRNPGEYALAVYLEGGDQLREGMDILKEMASFPNSYRPIAAFVLSSNWSQSYLDMGRKTTRAPDLDKALAYAQLDPDNGYISLRNAYRLEKALGLSLSHNPVSDTPAQPVPEGGDDPVVQRVRYRLQKFFSVLPPASLALFRSF